MEVREINVGNHFEWSEFASMGQGEDVVTLRNINYHELMNPIELNEEWLIKLGWKCKSTGKRKDGLRSYIYEKESFEIIFNKYMTDKYHSMWYDNNCFCSGKFEYVHQLQNLCFALTGEQLTIKK